MRQLTETCGGKEKANSWVINRHIKKLATDTTDCRYPAFQEAYLKLEQTAAMMMDVPPAQEDAYGISEEMKTKIEERNASLEVQEDDSSFSMKLIERALTLSVDYKNAVDMLKKNILIVLDELNLHMGHCEVTLTEAVDDLPVKIYKSKEFSEEFKQLREEIKNQTNTLIKAYNLLSVNLASADFSVDIDNSMLTSKVNKFNDYHSSITRLLKEVEL